MRSWGNLHRRRSWTLSLVAAAALGGVLAAPSMAGAANPLPTVPVTACPDAIPARTIGVLQNDISCTFGSASEPHFGIVLGTKAQLDLNGHTIDYQQSSQTISPVLCQKDCEVRGPGAITSAGAGDGIYSGRRGKAFVHDLDITGFAVGVRSAGLVTATNVTITGERAGLLVGRAILDHVAVTLPVPRDSDTADLCVGAPRSSGKVEGHDVSVKGCRIGVWGTVRVNLTNLTVTDSAVGVYSRRIQLADSSVTGSLIADIFAVKAPLLTNTTCDTSLRDTPDGPTTWGVCTND